MLNAAVIGHWGGNIGHGIMALGVEAVLAQAFDGVEIHRIEQHRPFDIYPEWHPFRRMGVLRHAQGGAIAQVFKNALNHPSASRSLWPLSWTKKLDVGITCGGPIITEHVADGDLGLMSHHMHGSFGFHGIPHLNLSLGACYPLEDIPERISGKDARFLDRLFDYSTVTTVRDRIAQRICAGLGHQFEVVADTGFVAGKGFDDLIEDKMTPQNIVINYQEYGANQDWGQGVDPVAWGKSLKVLIDSLRRRHQLVFVCHNDHENKIACELDPSIPRVQPKTMREYARFISTAKVGICSRIHAALPLISVGVPVIGIGNDTRLETLRTLNIKCFYVKEVTPKLLEDEIEKLINDRAEERNRLLELREKTFQRYIAIVRSVV